MSVDALLDLVERWARDVCQAELDVMARAVTALGLPEPFEHRRTVSMFRPLIPGVERVQLTERGGVLTVVDLELAEDRPALADFERRFGAWEAVPRAPESAFASVCFRVAPPDRPYECALFVRVRAGAASEVEVSSISLRRDRVR